MSRNSYLREYFKDVKHFSEVSQEDILFLLNFNIELGHHKSQYNTSEFVGSRQGYIDILKYIPNNIVCDSAPLYICYCHKCNSYFLDICKCVVNRKVKVCNSKLCQREYKVEKGLVHQTKASIPMEVGQYSYIDIPPFTKEEEIEYLDIINKKYNGVIINNDLFVKAKMVNRSISGEKYVKIEIKCLDCNTNRDASLSRWLGKKKGLKLCDCKQDNFKILRCKDSVKYLEKYKNTKHKKYKYLARGFIRNGIEYIWVLCKDCNSALFISVDDFLTNKVIKNCICFKGVNNARKCAKYIKYDLDAIFYEKVINNIELVDYFYTNDLTDKGTILWVGRCPFCGELFGRDPYTFISGHIKSCGCVKGYTGEETVNKVLNKITDSFHFKYYREKSFEGLVGIGNGYLRYDFYLFDEKGKTCLIEFQGKEHYDVNSQIGYFDSFEEKEKLFKGIQYHDYLKREFALKNQIPFLAIKYTLSEKKIEECIENFFKENNLFRR